MQQNIPIVIPGLEEIIGSLEDIIASMENFHGKLPHADLLPNVIKAEKTSNIYNPNSPSIHQTHWKILI